MTEPVPFVQGTVSHGTLRAEDLLPAYLETFYKLVPPEDRAAFDGQWRPDAVLERACAEGAGTDELEELDELLDDLQRRINDALPEGWYFGCLEGDGSDIGVWREPWESEDYVLTADDVRAARITVLQAPPVPAHDGGDWSMVEGDFTVAGATFGFRIDEEGDVEIDDAVADSANDAYRLGDEEDVVISDDDFIELKRRIRLTVRRIESDIWEQVLETWNDGWNKSAPSPLDS
jgi:hypothetical protein